MRTMRLVGELAGRTPRHWRGVLYRWVNPSFRLPPAGPGDTDCPTGGAYLTGGRMNAKGTQAPLYTALDPGVAALEVLRFAPPHFSNVEEALEGAAVLLQRHGHQLFAIEVDLARVLDLREHSDLTERYLEADWRPSQATCRGPHPTVPSQELGLAAFMAGYEGILRPSVCLTEAWGGRGVRP